MIRVNDRRISVEAREVTLDHLLHRIAESYGASIALEGDYSSPVSVSLHELSLNKALRRLVGKAPFVIIHTPSPVGGIQRSRPEIRIYAPSSGKHTGLSDQPPRQERKPPVAAESAAAPTLPVSNAEEYSPGQAEIEAMVEGATTEDLDRLGRVIEAHPDTELRYLALTLLGDMAVEGSNLAVERGLADPDPLFRSYVVETLGRIETPDAVRSLGYVVFGESDPAVRLIAVNNLAARDKEPAAAFLRVAAQDSDRTVRNAAIEALTSMR